MVTFSGPSPRALEIKQWESKTKKEGLQASAAHTLGSLSAVYSFSLLKFNFKHNCCFVFYKVLLPRQLMGY